MKIFSNDIFKMELINGEVIYCLCCKTFKYEFGCDIHYLNLSNLSLSYINSVDVKSVDLIGSLKGHLVKFKWFMCSLKERNKNALLREAAFIYSNLRNGRVYNSTKNKSLMKLSSLLGLDILSCSTFCKYKHSFPRYTKFISYCIENEFFDLNLGDLNFNNFINCDYKISDIYDRFKFNVLGKVDDESLSVSELVVV